MTTSATTATKTCRMATVKTTTNTTKAARTNRSVFGCAGLAILFPCLRSVLPKQTLAHNVPIVAAPGQFHQHPESLTPPWIIHTLKRQMDNLHASEQVERASLDG
jgi:hypothetical protein